MSELFLQLLNMSITAGWLVPAILLIRVLFKKAPKAIICLLWALVAVRLLLPFSFESPLSLLPCTEPIPQEILLSPTPHIDSGIPVINEAVNPILSENLSPNPGDSVNPLQIWTAIAANFWILGMIGLLIYAIVSYLRVRHRVRVCLPFEGNTYLCDNIDTPFILGIIKPRIYLPTSLGEPDRSYVIAHEQAHLRRFDHVWKPLGFLLLCVYWFNPLMWIGYILLCRDIELACDEHVLRDMPASDTAAYAEALLHGSAKQRLVTACPLAFGESGVASRIRHALHYKKPAFWLTIVSLIVCLALTIGFLTDPLKTSTGNGISDLDGLSVSVTAYDLTATPPTLTVRWTNRTNEQLIYGDSFELYRLENGVLVNTDTLDVRAFNSIGYMLAPRQKAEKTYSLYDYDLSKDGVYCFKSYALIDGGDATQYAVQVSFSIQDDTIIQAFASAKRCEHAWVNATCTLAKTCLLCNLTDGVARGHDWTDASCTQAAFCKVCNITQGDPLPHEFAEATCETAKVCTVCAYVVGKPLGHDMLNVTCTSGGICSRCNAAGNQTAPHTTSEASCTSDAVCSVCGTITATAFGHSFSEATCTTDGVCTHCGEIGYTAYGHSFTGGTCYEASVCETCGAIGETKEHWGIDTCKGLFCWYCGEFYGEETDRHIYEFDGRCTWCDRLNPDKVIKFPW